MSTPRDLVGSSLRLIGVATDGENLTASQLQDGLEVLNSMLEAWSAEGLPIHRRVREVFPLVAGQQTYTMGPDGDFDTSRPMVIMEARTGDGYTAPVEPVDPDATVQPNNLTLELPVEIKNIQEWASIAIKSTTSTYVSRIYLEGTFPLERINCWPIPSQANGLVLYSLKPFDVFADADVEIEFPPGYYRALRYNLAVELAPEYSKEASLTVQKIANNGKAVIERSVKQPLYLRNDAALVANPIRPWNWRTGDFNS